MRAASLFCLLLFCAGAAQSQSVYLQYTDPSGEAFQGAQFEVELWIDIPAAAGLSGGSVDVLYNPSLTSLNQIIPILPPSVPFCSGPDPCLSGGFDDGINKVVGFFIEAPGGSFIQGAHHVATLVFNAVAEGTAMFAVEPTPTPGIGFPGVSNFVGVNVSIVLPTCESPSLPENFHDIDATGLPDGWQNIFVNAQADSDGDGVTDQFDNCQLVANPTQCDTDGDSYGNHCDADFNNSCFVNFADLGIMKRDFFMSGPLDTDLNCDGITNFLDLNIMKDGFFQPPGPSGLPTASCNTQNTRGGGPIGWQTTANPNCDLTGDFIGDNVTGGLAEAACLRPSGGGSGAALCTTTPLGLAGAINPVLELHANFQPAGGLFQVIGGIDPPNAGTLPGYDVLFETDAPLGDHGSLPGATGVALVIDLPSVSPLYVCVLVSGDFDYAEVDHCIACALQCGGGPPVPPTRNPGCAVERF